MSEYDILVAMCVVAAAIGLIVGLVIHWAISKGRIDQTVRPIKTCESKSSLGVNGILITGTCPVCGQKWINNRDNRYCGGCGRKLVWKTDGYLRN